MLAKDDSYQNLLNHGPVMNNFVYTAIVAIGFPASYFRDFLTLADSHAILATANFEKTSCFNQDQQLFSGAK